jgi:hypothetical protein
MRASSANESAMLGVPFTLTAPSRSSRSCGAASRSSAAMLTIFSRSARDE